MEQYNIPLNLKKKKKARQSYSHIFTYLVFYHNLKQSCIARRQKKKALKVGNTIT